ncbi:unnamed protein product [Rotaria magnacalcarata]|uniref:Uncharacterized protein n=2 Tax=Rotaria magnacalcarata TaxID=392030 RepID=A0A819YJ28_9BILA|nr:unnamed protein product [Rotaria magnacalcarata]CAF4159038.1 unnamed protein product [Rotaria magnacalcarata]
MTTNSVVSESNADSNIIIIHDGAQYPSHLKNKHQSLFEEWKSNDDPSIKSTNQPKINSVFSSGGEKYATNNKRQKQLTNSIIQNLIINMGLSLSIVDHTSFNDFMNDVDSKYKPIHRRDLTRSFLPALHKKCTSKLQEICAEAKHVSLTLDISCDRRMRSYFGVTLHTIIDDKYKTCLLSFERLEGKHTSDKLAAEFDRIIQLYSLKDKIVRLITDNASNNLAAFDNIILPGFDDYFDGIIDDSSESESESKSNDKETDDYAPAVGEEKQLQTHEADDSIYQTTLDSATEEEFLRLPCFCHCLQLVVNDGIKASAAAASSLQKVASIAKLSHSSTVFSERLEKFNYTIPRANRTRWNNQFQTVKKVIDIPSSILNLILSDLKKNDLILNSKDRKVLEEFVSLFELFNEATVLTQGESYATICLVAPTVLGILFDLERELGSSTLPIVSLCEALIASIKARFSGLLRYFEIDVPFNTYCMSERFSDVIFLISPLLDARFKLLWLDSLHTFVKLRVVEKIRDAYVRYYSKLNFSVLQNAGADVLNTTEHNIDVMTKTRIHLLNENVFFHI